MSGGFTSGFSSGFGDPAAAAAALVTGDWGSLRTIIDGQVRPSDRVDCPVCGEVLDYNGEFWNCPRQGGLHYRERTAPKD